MRRAPILAALLLAALALVVVALTGWQRRTRTAPTADGLATVVEVVDGDTAVVDLAGRQETIRLIGIDTSNLGTMHLPPQE